MKIDVLSPGSAGKSMLGQVKKMILRPEAAAVLSGLLMTAAFPKTGAWPLAWIALIPLIHAFSPTNGNLPLQPHPIVPRRSSESFRFGMLAGIVHYITLLYWLVPTIHTYGGLPLFMAVPILMLLAVYLAVYWGIFFMLYNRFPVNALWELLVWPALWISLSWLRAHLFTGFPWGALGYSQFPWTEFIQIAEWTGVYGVSWLIVLVNFLICRALLSRMPIVRRMIFLFCLIIIFSLIHGFGRFRIMEVSEILKTSPTLTAVLVQGNISQDEKWDPGFQTETLDRYIRLSTQALSSPADIVIWPETAAPFYFGYDGARSLRLINFAIQHQTDLCTGIPTFSMDASRQPSYYNTALLIDSRGEEAGRYHKSHLVPFGEYVPLKRFLPFIGKLVAQVGDFSPGDPGTLLTVNGHPVAPLICYELIFPNLSRLAVEHGADCLINLTNDAWFGTTSGPYQHFSMGVFRAIENRRPLIRAANTGISGHIDATGKIRETSRLQTETAIRIEAAQPDIRTAYTRWGDLFAFICMGISVVFLLQLARKKAYIM